jgi:branched-subunit amino acid aminotransferase/4-amino-4-deoxychorismate lyase
MERGGEGAQGHLYQLEPHLDRILRSAEKARIPPPLPKDALRKTILDTVIASGQQSGELALPMPAVVRLFFPFAFFG